MGGPDLRPARRGPPEPLAELRRLVRVQRAYNPMSAGDDCVALEDWACAEREYGAARGAEPENAEMAYWHAVALATAGKLDAARPLFAQAFAADPRWRELCSGCRPWSSCRRTRSCSKPSWPSASRT